MFQTQDGFIWIGTQTGLQRYDGKRFVTYLDDVHDTTALHSAWINTILEDSRKRLWIGTEEAPYILDRATNRFYNFNLHLKKGQDKASGVWQFLEDKQGTIWLAAHNAYYRFNEAEQCFESVNNLLAMANNTWPSGMALDKQGNVWFATTGGLKKLVVKTNTVFDKNHNPEHDAVLDIKGPTASILFDDQGNTWVSSGYERMLYRCTANKLKTYLFDRGDYPASNLMISKAYVGGLFKSSTGVVIVPLLSVGLALYDQVADSFSIIKFNNNIPYCLHQSSISDIGVMEDKEKNLWISTDFGLNILSLNANYFTNYKPQTNKQGAATSNREVSDFLETSNGDIYVSNYFVDGGITRYDKNLIFKEHYAFADPSIKYEGIDHIWNLFMDTDGVIWAPTQPGNILKLDTRTNKLSMVDDSLLHGCINDIQKDADNNIWIAHWNKGLIKIDALTKKPTRYNQFNQPTITSLRRVMCFLQDKEKIWVGTIQNGLQLFDKKTGTFIASFVMDERNSTSITSNNVIGIVAYNEDTLLLATQGGVNIFDKKSRTFTAISSKDGLPNNLVQGIVLDDEKNLWVALAGGFSKINIRDGSINNYDASDGIIDNRFNKKFYRLHDGRLMIGASDGFLVFNPHVLNTAAEPADVTITSFKLLNKPMVIDSLLHSSQPITLSYQENNFQIEFASLQFFSSNKTKYYYQLEGIDKNWIEAGAEQSVNYNQLPPGKYIFKVKCANRYGNFSRHVTSFAIHIIPPFYKRWWFYFILSLFLCILLYSIVKWRERNIKTSEANKTKLQQLTAEKYKIQFESEQISNFFTSSLLNKNDVDDVLWDVAKNLIGKLGFVDCVIYLWNADKTALIQKAGYGQKGSIEELQKQQFDVVPGQGVVGAVAQSGEPLIIADTSLDSRYRVDDMERLSEICVPIKYNEQLIGVIDSEHHEKNFFTRQHLQVLTTIATFVGSKIKSIEAEQHLRHQRAELADINQQLVEVQLAALRSQMNPHFIFNALNSIKKFVIANEPINAEKYLGKFSKLIRSILDNSQSGMVTIEKELQLLRLYLDLEQLRFGSKLTYSIEVDEAIDTFDIRIPSMIVQPFVENAMLHGIMHREDHGRLAVRFVMCKDWLEITIEDNGVGRAKSMEYKSDNGEGHRSIGIEVTTKRLQALKKNAETPAGVRFVDLVAQDGSAAGTQVIISAPIY